MGNLFGSKQQKQTSTTTPWSGQQPYLTSGFQAAQSDYNTAKDTPFYGGDLYANMDPLTSQGIDLTSGYATGAGSNLASGVSGASSGLFGSGQGSLGMFQQLAGLAGQDPTQGNIASAGQYANNPYMDGMVDAASRDIYRNLYENELPGINQAATGTGNVNSSRAGIADGIARRGAQDAIADVSANLRGQAYQSGLGLAENARTSNLGVLGGAASGLSGLFGQSLSGANMGQDMALQNYEALIKAGQLGQQDEQGDLDAQFKQWLGQDQRSSDLLNRYWSIVGNGSFGGTQTSTAPGQSPVSNILGTALAVGSMFSDRRLKDNIVKVGEMADGLGVYRWTYRRDKGLELPDGTQFGVMADEVAVLRPHALGEPIGDYLTVQYDRL